MAAQDLMTWMGLDGVPDGSGGPGHVEEENLMTWMGLMARMDLEALVT